MDHRRRAAGCRARTLPHAGDGRLRRRRAAARTGRGGHRPHASRTLRVAVPPRSVAASRRRGARRGDGDVERRPFRGAPPRDEAAGRRRTEGRHGDAQQGSVEQPVLRRLRRHDRLDEGRRRRVDIRLCGLRPLGGVHGGAGRRQTDQLLLDAAVEQYAALPRRRDGRVGGREGRTGPARLRRDVAAVPRRFRAASGRKRVAGEDLHRHGRAVARTDGDRRGLPRGTRSAAGHRAGRQPRQLQALPAAARHLRLGSAGGRSRGYRRAPRRRAGDDLLRLLLAPLSQHVHLLRSGRGDRGGVVRRGQRLRRLPALGLQLVDGRPAARFAFPHVARGRYLRHLSGRPVVDPFRAPARRDSGCREDPYPARRTGPRELGRVRRKTGAARSGHRPLRIARAGRRPARAAGRGQAGAQRIVPPRWETGIRTT